MAGKYDGYEITALPSFTMRYSAGGKYAHFYFEVGADKGVTVYSRPTSRGGRMSPDEIPLAFERVVAHLRFVGYEVFVDDKPV